MRPKVVVTDYSSTPGAEANVLAPHADLVFANARNEAELIERHADADVFLVFHEMFLTAASLDKFPRLRGIVRCGVGYDNVDLTAAGRAGVVVCNIPDYGTEDVADHALLMMLAIARRLRRLDDAVREGIWDATMIFGAPRMRGKTLGILGCGRIGTAMALRGKALGMRVVFYDPYQPVGYEKALGVERSYDLEGMLSQAQFVSVHTPLTPQTHHILNAKTLRLLPRGAYIVNTARGPCVDPEGLLEALEAGWVEAAGLDVLEREPLDDDRLRLHPQVLMTPHAAFYSVEGFDEMRRKAGEEAIRMLHGEAVRNPVNRPWLVEPRCVLPPNAGDSPSNAKREEK